MSVTLVIGEYLINSCQKKGIFHWEGEIRLKAILCEKIPFNGISKKYGKLHKKLESEEKQKLQKQHLLP